MPARILQELLETVEIPRLEWPARSPDMNPIEHVWDTLGRNEKRQPLPETI
jgi:transposase